MAACHTPAETRAREDSHEAAKAHTVTQQGTDPVMTTPTAPTRPWAVEMHEGKWVVMLEDLTPDEFDAVTRERHDQALERAVPARHEGTTEWTLFSSSGGAPIKARTRSFWHMYGADSHLIAHIEPERALPPESLVLAVKGDVSRPKAHIAPLRRVTLTPDQARAAGDDVRAEIAHQMPDQDWPKTLEQGAHFALYKAQGVDTPAGVIAVNMPIPGNTATYPMVSLGALFLVGEAMLPTTAVVAPAEMNSYRYTPIALEDLDGDGTYRLIYRARYHEGEYLFLGQPNDKGGAEPIRLGGSGA